MKEHQVHAITFARIVSFKYNNNNNDNTNLFTYHLILYIKIRIIFLVKMVKKNLTCGI